MDSLLEKLAEREGLLAPFGRSSLAPLGITVASRRRPASLREAVEPILSISRVRIHHWVRWNLAEREESIALCGILFHKRFFQAANIRTITTRAQMSL
jgi:hypothetical protein